MKRKAKKHRRNTVGGPSDSHGLGEAKASRELDPLASGDITENAFRYGQVGLLLVGTVLGALFLTRNDIWFDEAASYFFARFSGVQFFLVLLSEDTHGPLYYGLLKLWTTLCGEGPLVGRLPSVICAVGSVLVTARIGALVFSRRIGLVGGLVVALSPFHIYYSQEVRFYSFVELLIAIHTYCLLVIIERSARATENEPLPRRFWLGAVVTASACMLTFYASALVFLGEATATLFVLPRIRPRRIILIFVTIGLIFVPWLPAAYWQATHTHGSIGWIRDRSSFEFLSQTYKAFVAGRRLDAIALGPAPVLVGGLLAGVYACMRGKHVRRVTLSLSFLFPVLSLLAISNWKPMYEPRYLIMVLPFFFLLAVAGIFGIRHPWLRRILLLGVLGCLAMADVRYYTTPKMGEGWRQATAFVNGQILPDDVLIAAPSHEVATLSYYFPHFKQRHGAEVVEHIIPDLARGKRVWLFSRQREHSALRNDLVSNSLEMDSRDFGMLTVSRLRFHRPY